MTALPARPPHSRKFGWRVTSLDLPAQFSALLQQFPVPSQAILVAQLRDLNSDARADAVQQLVWREAVDALTAIIDACSHERHPPTELKLRAAVETLARARHAMESP